MKFNFKQLSKEELKAIGALGGKKTALKRKKDGRTLTEKAKDAAVVFTENDGCCTCKQCKLWWKRQKINGNSNHVQWVGSEWVQLDLF